MRSSTTNIELYESTLPDHGPFQLFAPPASRGGAGPSGAPPDPSPSEAAAPTDSHSTAPHPQSSSTCSLPLAVAALAPPQAHGSPVPRRWPNDFFVYKIAAGLRAMEAFAAAEPALKQDEVFRRAFALSYVKSTFCRHRALWRGAGEARECYYVFAPGGSKLGQGDTPPAARKRQSACQRSGALSELPSECAPETEVLDVSSPSTVFASVHARTQPSAKLRSFATISPLLEDCWPAHLGVRARLGDAPVQVPVDPNVRDVHQRMETASRQRLPPSCTARTPHPS
ncbi:hypothetical protein BC628DRAFT_1505706 [Trametes gibbosa]|nr:hypothetical protein BC628DRAFT_1505706 [Trametes gibbosa]